MKQVGEWREALSADGKKYYYNTATRQTSWIKPVEEPKVDGKTQIENNMVDVELALAETQLELEEIEFELEQSSKAYETGTLH